MMDIPNRKVTLVELRLNTGARSARKWIVFEGVVYDVTDCPKWQGDMHEMLHFPGQDLTTELPDAPHTEKVLSRPCVKIIGRFVN
jgi:predicted heme/steroid binding protein